MHETVPGPVGEGMEGIPIATILLNQIQVRMIWVLVLIMVPLRTIQITFYPESVLLLVSIYIYLLYSLLSFYFWGFSKLGFFSKGQEKIYKPQRKKINDWKFLLRKTSATTVKLYQRTKEKRKSPAKTGVHTSIYTLCCSFIELNTTLCFNPFCFNPSII